MTAAVSIVAAADSGDAPEGEGRPTSSADSGPVTLAVSATGNGIGVAIVRLSSTGGHAGRVAIFHVLPKVWRSARTVGAATTDDARSAERDDAERDDAREASVGARTVNLVPILSQTSRESIHVTVFEGDYVTVPRGVGRLLRDAIQTNIGTKESDGQKLFAPAVSGTRTPVPYWEHDRSDAVASLWRLVEAYLREDLVNAFDDVELFGTIAQHIPALEQAIRRAFLAAVEDALRVRRSNFVSFTEETLFVRGRMEVRSLIDRRATKRLPVTCTFDDLSHDTLLWQAIRAALRIAASDTEPSIGSEAARLDSRLADVSLVGVATALDKLSAAQRAPEARRLRKLVILTRAVLLFQYPAGGLESAPQSHAVTLKVSTADLWEKLLALLLDQNPGLSTGRVPRIRLFAGSGQSKQPDLVRKAGERTVVVDAKYKRQLASPTLSSLSMSDQYQCYAYANLLDATTAFVTVKVDGPGSGQFIPDTICLGRGAVGQAPAVAVVPIPFPAPEDAADGARQWAAREHDRLTSWLVDPLAYEV